MRYAEKRLLEIAQQFHDRPATVRQARAKSVPLFATRPFKLKRYQPGDTHKVCTECRLEKPLADFSVRAGGALGHTSKCMQCLRVRAKAYTRKKREGAAGRVRPDACECCQQPSTARNRALHWDHDHKTGQFRGWLCTRCNSALGHAGESVDRLLQLVQYLRRNGSG